MDNREETTEIKRPKAAADSPSLESSITAEDETATVAMAAAAVEVKGLSYTFPDGTVALQDVSFTVAEKEKVAIIGPNGAGKSTLLLLLNGLLRGQGLVKISGLEVCRRNVKVIRSRTGLVFQDPDDQLFMPTVLDDVAFGLCLRSEDRYSQSGQIVEKVKDRLKELRAEHLINRSTMRLSPGEKKKVALAGVLITEPEILLLDEPASGLDPASRRWLEDYLMGLERMLIMTTHDLELARKVAQRIILMSGGRLVAEGGPEEILDNRELLEASGL
ncbi:MAG: energy-coupling factor ABC transporter ATP-binding protein [Acidobacteriota bacterium]|nr:energy-coupling factor ABC transporter ATP-binding protein [Acidobacteriota bacterium]